MSTGITFNGMGILNTKNYITKTYGKETTERILTSMSIEAQGSVRFALGSAKYPVEHVSEFLGAIKKTIDPKDPDINFKISNECAKATFSLLYRLYFKFGNPTKIIQKAASVWNNLCNTGKLEVDVPSDNEVLITLKAFPYADPEFCGQRLMGWYQAPLELSGCKNVKGQHIACQSRGAPHCVWRYSWK